MEKSGVVVIVGILWDFSSNYNHCLISSLQDKQLCWICAIGGNNGGVRNADGVRPTYAFQNKIRCNNLSPYQGKKKATVTCIKSIGNESPNTLVSTPLCSHWAKSSQTWRCGPDLLMACVRKWAVVLFYSSVL